MPPGVDRQPLKKLGPDPDALLRLMERWRDEAVKAGKMIERIALAFEAGRDGFWLARWLQARGIEVKCSGACRRQAEELKRIRTYPDPRKAE